MLPVDVLPSRGGVLLLLKPLFYQRSLNPAGADHVHANAVRREVDGQILGQRDDAALCRRVGACIRLTYQPDHGGHVNHGSLRFLQGQESKLGAEKDTLEIRVQKPVPILLGEGFDALRVVIAGIVHEDVDAPRLTDDLLRHGADVAGLADIAHDAVGLAAGLPEFDHLRVDRVSAPRYDEAVRSFFAEYLSDPRADPLRPARHDRRLVFEPHGLSFQNLATP